MTSPSDVASDDAEAGQEDLCELEVVHADAVRQARSQLPSPDGVERAVEVASLLANPTRLRILAALAPMGEEPDPRLCVCDLAVVIDVSENQTSHQLRALRLAGLVRQRRESRLVFYTLAADPTLRACIAALCGAATRSRGRLL